MSEATFRKIILVILTGGLGGMIGLSIHSLNRPDQKPVPEIERLDRVCDFVRSATSDAADFAESDQPERREAGIVTLKLIKNALMECVR